MDRCVLYIKHHFHYFLRCVTLFTIINWFLLSNRYIIYDGIIRVTAVSRNNSCSFTFVHVSTFSVKVLDGNVIIPTINPILFIGPTNGMINYINTYACNYNIRNYYYGHTASGIISPAIIPTLYGSVSLFLTLRYMVV